MAVIANLIVKVSARTKPFRDALRTSRFGVSKLSASIRGLSRVLTGFGARLLAIAGIGGFGILIKNSFTAIDATTKLARQLGITTEALLKLRHAAELTGAGSKSLDAGLATMSKRLGEAARGGGAAGPALKDLGLSAKELIKLSPDKAFMRIAKALQEIEGPMQRNAIAANLFSKANQGLLLTLAEGPEGLAMMGAELERLGGTFTDRQGRMVEAANDAIAKMQVAFKRFVTQVAIDLAPLVAIFADDLTNSVKGVGEELSFIGKSFEFLADLAHDLSIVWKDLAATVANIQVGWAQISGGDVKAAKERAKRLRAAFEAALIAKTPSERAAAFRRAIRMDTDPAAITGAAAAAGVGAGGPTRSGALVKGTAAAFSALLEDNQKTALDLAREHLAVDRNGWEEQDQPVEVVIA